MARLSQLKHPGWLGVVLPIALAIGSTFTPQTVRGLLLLAAVAAATATFHRTEYGARKFRRSAVAMAVFLTVAVLIFVVGYMFDARSKPSQSPIQVAVRSGEPVTTPLSRPEIPQPASSQQEKRLEQKPSKANRL